MCPECAVKQAQKHKAQLELIEMEGFLRKFQERIHTLERTIAEIRKLADLNVKEHSNR